VAAVASETANVPEIGAAENLGTEAVVAGTNAFDIVRYPRLKWLDSTAGTGVTPTAPFTPVFVDEQSRTVRILGRALEIGENGLPAQYFSAFNGSNTDCTDCLHPLLLDPVSFTGAEGRFTFRFTRQTAVEAAWKAVGDDVTVAGSVGFDGRCRFNIRTSSDRPRALVFRLAHEDARYWMGLGREGGEFPSELDWRWDASCHQDAAWFGRVNAGLMFRLRQAGATRPLVNAYYRWKPLTVPASWGGGGVSVRDDGKVAEVRAWSGPETGRKLREFSFDLYLTPFKPIDLKR